MTSLPSPKHLFSLLTPPEQALARDAAFLTERAAARAKLVHDDGHLGAHWRWLRAERSLREMSDRAPDVSSSHLQKLETSELPNPSLKVLLALHRMYGTAGIDDLLGMTPAHVWANRYL